MRCFIAIFFLLSISIIDVPVHAVTLRYAIIVGSNIGVDADGTQPFLPLKYAEREARVLRDRLVDVSNFDTSTARTKLLLAATKQELKAAFREIAEQKKQDEMLFKDMESIFLLYYTGHGLAGRLLLRDGPLMAKSLAGLFNMIGADFSVGIFDACYAGSLDSVLSEKGIRATPGLNMVAELPSEVLSAKGSIWYVSSGAGQPSYEDKTFGGVFTHFFIEALEKAEVEGPGITLENIWQYARHKTIAYTAEHDRTQTPEQLVSKLRAKAPVYFSFPIPRDAYLVLSEALAGRFVLIYGDGQLAELFEKPPGIEKELAIYPGSARLIWLDAPGDQNTDFTFTLAKGGTLFLKTLPESAPSAKIGEQANPLFKKGVGVEGQVTAVAIEPSPSLSAGAGYGLTLAEREMLQPRHRIFLPLRFDRAPVMAALHLSYGVDRREYAAWSYTAHAFGADLRGGYQWSVKRVRLSAGAAVSGAYIWQRYSGNMAKRGGAEVHVTAVAGALLPGIGNVYFEILAEGGPLYAPGSGEMSEKSWCIAGGVALSAYYRFF
jgi:hypothetical protein